MYSDLELLNSVQSSIAYKSNLYEDLIQQRQAERRKATWVNITSDSRAENAKQNSL